MIYYHKNGQVAWFFARLVRKDQPNTLFVWDGTSLNISHPRYFPSWLIKQATPTQLHSLMWHIWNSEETKTE
jgi:hypothetical protein